MVGFSSLDYRATTKFNVIAVKINFLHIFHWSWEKILELKSFNGINLYKNDGRVLFLGHIVNNWDI